MEGGPQQLALLGGARGSAGRGGCHQQRSSRRARTLSGPEKAQSPRGGPAGTLCVPVIQGRPPVLGKAGFAEATGSKRPRRSRAHRGARGAPGSAARGTRTQDNHPGGEIRSPRYLLARSKRKGQRNRTPLTTGALSLDKSQLHLPRRSRARLGASFAAFGRPLAGIGRLSAARAPAGRTSEPRSPPGGRVDLPS